MWILKKAFYWHPTFDGTLYSNPGEEDIKRAYELWDHAESLVKDASNAFQLADALSNLKRALNKRLMQIESLYKIKQLFSKNQAFLETLNEVGIVRPFIIKQLFDIRNGIEHNDKPVPSVSRCRELLDATWYFLRSTDAVCSYYRNEIQYNPKSFLDGHFCSLKLIFDASKSQSFYGRFPADYLHPKEVVDSIQFKCTRSTQLGDSPAYRTLLREHPELKPTDRDVRGRIILPKELYLKVLRDLLLTRY